MKNANRKPICFDRSRSKKPAHRSQLIPFHGVAKSVSRKTEKAIAQFALELSHLLEAFSPGDIYGKRKADEGIRVKEAAEKLQLLGDIPDTDLALLRLVLLSHDLGRPVERMVTLHIENPSTFTIPDFGTATSTLIGELLDGCSGKSPRERSSYLNANHARLSEALLIDKGFLEVLTNQQDRVDVLTAVRFHNVRSLPGTDLLSIRARTWCEALMVADRFDLLERACTLFFEPAPVGGLVAQWMQHFTPPSFPRPTDGEQGRQKIAMAVAWAEKFMLTGDASLSEEEQWLTPLQESLSKAPAEFLIKQFEEGGLADRVAMIREGSYQGYMVYFMCMLTTLPPSLLEEALREKFDSKFLAGLQKLQCPPEVLLRLSTACASLHKKVGKSDRHTQAA